MKCLCDDDLKFFLPTSAGRVSGVRSETTLTSAVLVVGHHFTIVDRGSAILPSTNGSMDHQMELANQF